MKNHWRNFFLPHRSFPSLVGIQKLKITRWIACLLILATMNLTHSCYYFKVNTKQNPAPETISNLDDQGKNFILHFNNKTLKLNNVALTENNLSGEVSEIGEIYSRTVVNTNRPNRYYKKASLNQSYLLKEVHLYVEELVQQGDNKVSIPTSSISKVEIYDKDTATTTGSWILGAVGIAASVYLILAIIVLIFKESCPFIYTHDGEKFNFTGEIFSGAIQPGLERHDYLLLPDLKPKQEEYLLKVTNEVKEIQHINLMELKVIDHAKDVNILMDKYGQVQTWLEPVLPNKAETHSGQDILSLINKKDTYAYLFNDMADSEFAFSEVILTFNKPESAQFGKLLVRAKNSLWIEHVFSSFHDMFGGMYHAFDRREAKKPAEELRSLMFEQGFPLRVYVERDGTWVLQDFYEIAGPMAMKNDVLVVDLKETAGETVKIKLETGLMFWELDYAGMDFTENVRYHEVTVPALQAIDENNLNIVESIIKDDQEYYSQPVIGNEAVISFPVPGFTDESRTVVLHSKGYYKIIRDQQGRAQWKKLKSFREPGRMAQYSKELYEEFISMSLN
jgi:hypothetical protein